MRRAVWVVAVTGAAMLLSLPARGRWTFYGWAGEWFVLVCAALLGMALAVTLRACRSSRSPAER